MLLAALLRARRGVAAGAARCAASLTPPPPARPNAPPPPPAWPVGRHGLGSGLDWLFAPTPAAHPLRVTPHARLLHADRPALSAAPSPPAAAAAAAAAADSTATSAAAAALFDECWARLEARYGRGLVAPKEIVWLNGAPGSGKGANTPFILQSRGLSRAVAMSSLLEETPALKARIDAGDLLPDAMVCDALLDAIFNPATADGAGLIVDGFPRTATQVDFTKCLYDRLLHLSTAAAGSADEWRYPRPGFKVVILYVDEAASVTRQLARAKIAAVHNERVLDAGTGEMVEQRATDTDVQKCRRRFEVFRAHYSTVLRLKLFFPFSLIDAMGTPAEVCAQIARELRYQSSLDLGEATYQAIRHLPLAADMVREARQALVASLDRAHARHGRLFARVTGVLENELLPLLKRCALAGHAEWSTPSPLFATPLAQKILIDILTDRGFAVSYAPREVATPVRVDLKTGAVECEHKVLHTFRLSFERATVRDASATAAQLAAACPDAGGAVVIGGTEVPDHLDASVRDTVGKGGGGQGGRADGSSSGGERKPRSSLHDPVLWGEGQEEEARPGPAGPGAAAG